MMKRTGFIAAAAIVSTIAIAQAQTPAAPAQQPPAAPAAPPQAPPPDPTPPDDLPRPSTTDPRAALKAGAPGVKAAEAAWDMEVVTNLPNPPGFTDEAPLGTAPPKPVEGAPRTPPNPNQLSYTNSDLAFSGTHV